MKSLRYETLDVFTRDRFGGNPLAVVHDAEGLSAAMMQAIAAEFNYSETTFLLPPDDPAHDARVRIFTPTEEMPFAGHPNVGTAWALASRAGDPARRQLLFEEQAGLVVIELSWNLDTLEAVEVAAPRPLSLGAELAPAVVAECLGFGEERVRTASHAPVTASVGAPFVFAEVEPGTLPAVSPSGEAFARFAARGVAVGIFVYEKIRDGELEARMFWPAGTVREDPATGSAAAALAGLLAHLSEEKRSTFVVWQGRAMGRLSRIHASASADPSGGIRARVAGACVRVMEGHLSL